MPAAYYNENDPFAADWLENLIAEEMIPHGYVDRRSIADVEPGDLRGFTQCHFFAGIGGWAYAARLAGWPDDLPLWTGSPPCQPFSVAGKQRGTKDHRHLWPEQFRLIRAARPARWFGEQVAGKAGLAWLDGVLADLENSDYAGRAFVIPACSVGAPHRRERLWIAAEGVGDTDRHGRTAGGCPEPPAGQRYPADAGSWQRDGRYGDADWLLCADGKRRRVKPGLPLLAHGVPSSVAGSLAGYGNAIVPHVAAEVLASYLETL